MRVTGLSIAPVKGTRLQRVEHIELSEHGVRENRRFFLIDEHDRMHNSKTLGDLQAIVSRYDDAARRLELEFTDGRVVAGPVELGDELTTQFYSDQVLGRAVLGEFSDAISAHVGRPLRLLEADARGAIDRRCTGPVSLISQASLDRLAAEGALDLLDPRRFRMLIEIDGVPAHAEDAWIGRALEVGAALIRPLGHVGRCLITGRDPETGVSNLPTLDLLGQYRRDLDTTEPLPFGIYGEVIRAGQVRVGDSVAVSGE